MKKKVKVTVHLLLLMVLLAGCGKQFGLDENEETINYPQSDVIVVGVSQIGSESVWRTANTVSIQNAFTKDNGFFLIFDNARQKQENQIKAIRSFISQNVDYIVFSPITETGWDTVLQEAKDASIPVILMDRTVKVQDESLYTAWVGSDFVEEGRKAGYWLEQYLREEGRERDEIRFVVLQGTEGASSVNGRTDGFDEIASKHSNWIKLEQTDAEYTTAKGYEVMKNMLAQYEDIDVVVSQNDDMTFGAIEALKEAGLSTGVDGDVIIISFDAVKSALTMVDEGIINVDIECNPLQGEEVRRVLQALQNHEEITKYNYVNEVVFTQENVKDQIESRTY